MSFAEADRRRPGFAAAFDVDTLIVFVAINAREGTLMAKANSFFRNEYTFEIRNSAPQYSSYEALITKNAVAAIEHLSDFIEWKGKLDFVVQFGSPGQFGAPPGGLLPAYGGIASDRRTFAASEALTGVDANGATPDLGLRFIPNANGQLTNYGNVVWFDPNPSAYNATPIPAGQHDFFSIFVHESLHGLGFWSTAQHGDAFGKTTFDDFTVKKGNQYFFSGANIIKLLGEDLPLAMSGSRDHYGLKVDGTGPVTRGTVFEFGNYDTRWHLAKVELAVLRDLGFTTANDELLPLVEQPNDIVGRPAAPEPSEDFSFARYASVAVNALVTGVLPTQAHYANLVSFGQGQFKSYEKAGVANPALGPFEALGKALAADPTTTAKFAARFGANSDSSFLEQVYDFVFDKPLAIDAKAALQAQIDYFEGLYLGAGIGSESASLQARGAVFGQVIGYVFVDPNAALSSKLDEAVKAKVDASLNGDYSGFGAALPGFTATELPPVRLNVQSTILTAGIWDLS
jgi:hypothetical protein